MGSGYLSQEILKFITGSVKNIEGDFAEIGIYKASLFSRLVPIGKIQEKEVHGFDSFSGLSEPTEKDKGYEKGDLNVGGIEKFHEIMNTHDVDEKDYHLYSGYVPDCFNAYSLHPIKFSFVYIDLDLSEPTKQAIEWAFPKLLVGGIIGFDDYFHKRNFLASPVIDEFLDCEKEKLTLIHFSNNQIFYKKGDKNEIL